MPSSNERETLFQSLSEYARHLVKQYADCGYRADILEEIALTIQESRNLAHPLTPQKPVIEYGLEYCLEKARSDGERFGHDVCHYIEMSLSPGKNWFKGWVLGHRK